MMADVRMPNGDVVRFPDDMPKEQIRDMIAKKFPEVVKSEPAEAPAPEPQKRSVWQHTNDVVRGIADAATLGFSDEFGAAMATITGIDGEFGEYEKNLEAQRARDRESGAGRLVGQVAGAVAMPGGLSKTVAGAAAKGAGLGSAYGFGSGEDGLEDRLKSAAVGGFAGGAAGGALQKVSNALSRRAAQSAVPTNTQLRKAADAAYKAADDAGIILKPSAVQNLSAQIVDDLAEFGYDPALQPGVQAVLRRLEGLSRQNVTLRGMDVVRRVAANAAKDRNNPSQQAIASKIINRIDDYIETLPDEDLLTGNLAQGQTALNQARDLWRRLRKSEMVDTAVEKAELRAASTGSGGNADNAIRQNVRRIVENPRGLTDAEKAAAERVVRGTPGQNVARLVGKAAPTGIVSGGIGSSIGAGAGSMVAGGPGAMVGSVALPAIGAAAKRIADNMTKANVDRLSTIIRSGGLSADDLVALARGGQIANPAVKKLDRMAGRLGLTLPEIAAISLENAVEP